MADNITITQGTGTVVASDDIASVFYHWWKLFDATADSVAPLVVTSAGAIKTAPSVPTTSQLTSASLNPGSSGDNTLVAAVGGQTIRVFRFELVFEADVNVIFKDSTPTNMTGAMFMRGGGSIVLDFDSDPWFVTAVGKAFQMNLSSAVKTYGRIWYTQS